MYLKTDSKMCSYSHFIPAQSQMAGRTGGVKYLVAEFMPMALCVIAAWLCGMKKRTVI